jgi:hypothetical protein
MSNYTKNTNFTAKDTLTSGDPAKVIKGAEFDTEFNSIQTAVNSKADSNNSQLTGTTDAQAVETTGDVTVGGNLSVTGNATIEGNLTFGNADTDTVSFVADVDSSIIPDDDNTYDLGSPTKQWRNVYVDGTANIDSLVADTADINGGTIDGVSISGSTASFSGEISANGGIALGDNDKATFGASDDLQIYHDTLNSVIADKGTGNLVVAADDFRLTNSTQTANMIKADEGGAVTLTHNGGNKISTTSTGVDVTGTVTADGLVVDGNITLSGAGTGNRWVLLDETNTYEGALRLQAGGGSSGFGGSVNMYGHAHATKAGDVAIGISSGSGGSFRVNDNGVDAGGDSLKVDANGDVSFYEDTGTTAKMVWDASAETLTVTNSNNNEAIRSQGRVDIVNPLYSSGNFPWRLKDVGGNFQINYYNTSNQFVIKDNGNVGIGTASPSAKLASVGFSGTTLIQALGSDSNGYSDVEIKSTGTTGSSRLFFSDTAGQSGFVKYGHSDNSLQFGTNGSERARIDSSGNLLVGTTSTDFNSFTGVRCEASGALRATTSSSTAGMFNRRDSDGSIITLRKDGSTVGSIRSRAGLVSTIILDPRSGGGGLTGTAGGVEPVNNNGDNTNGLYSLGTAASRFKDLYLSGGVYLGGTGSANKLDDYEEGVWNPTVGGVSVAGTTTYTVQKGSYTKVGNVVHINAYVGWSDIVGSTGYLILGGLPFLVSGDSDRRYSSITMGYAHQTTWGSGTPLLHTKPFSTEIYIGSSTSGGNWQNTAMTTSGDLIISGTYRTDS